MPELPRGTVTFLFTDIEGSTALLKRLGEGYASVLDDHRRLVRAAFAAHGGREIDTQGDSFFYVFPRAKSAIGAAVEGQRALAEHRWPMGVELRVRMGLHSGEPLVGEDRYVGIGVNRAARIAAAAHGGQVLLSDATRALVEDDLPSGIYLRDLGSFRLKDIDRPERVSQVLAEGLASEFPSLRGAEPVRVVPVLRRRLSLAAALVGLSAAAVGYLLVSASGSSVITARPNSLGVIDPTSGRLSRVVGVGDTPTSVAVGQGAVWVLNANAGSVSKVDPRSGTVETTFPVATAPVDLAVSTGFVWVTTSAFRLLRVDPSSKIVFPIRLPQSRNPAQGASVAWVATANDAVWATGSGAAMRILPSRITATFPNVNCCGGVALGGGRAWLTDATGVLELNAASGHVLTHVSLDFAGGQIAFAEPYLWVVDPQGAKAWAIDVKTATVAGSVAVGTQPNGVAVGEGGVWVSSADGTVSKIDPGSFKVVKQITVGGTPAGIAVGDGSVWVTVD
jgi:YVTN family beta-propeller protein